MNNPVGHTNPAPDPDLLERYVLGRVTPEEKALVEQLARSDAEWRTALAREQRIAAGVRRAGALALKEKLAARLRSVPISSIAATRYVAAAAVLLVLLSVVLVNRWFSSHGPEQNATSDEPARSIQATAPEAGAKSEDRREKPAPAPPTGQLGTESALHGTPKEGPSGGKDKNGAKEELRPGIAAGGKAVRTDENTTQREEGKLITTAPAQEQVISYWTMAHVLPANTAGTEFHPPTGAQKSRQETDLLQKKDRAAEAAPMRTADTSQGPLPVTLSQKSFSSLDNARQRQFQGGGASEVPALIEQQRGSLHITLYTDAPIDPLSLRRATLEQVNQDSFLLRLPAQTLGLHLPREVQKQQAAPANR